MDHQEEQQQHHQQRLSTLALTALLLAIVHGVLTVRDNTVFSDYPGAEAVAEERYSVLRLRTDNLTQFMYVKKLFDSSTDLKVSSFFMHFYCQK
ncbi:unnamed protein product [Gongylonema pulchrum]|uniref:Membrane magnesium transporter n=1 Tax=Gongylonema pulchrum TaxID=637853 RepID=A0A183EMT7_9BILA|nr:unnamed protein product [Gongylonema pulchrum]